MEALRGRPKDEPLVVLAHSLGSILAYDVLTAPEFKDRDLRLVVTAGSPLGIPNVVDKVRDWRGPAALPTKTPAWHNFYDRRDKVGWFGSPLIGQYPTPPPLNDKRDVRNQTNGHHDLVGYLVDADLRAVVWRAVGFKPGGPNFRP